MPKKKGLTYKDAGVNIDAADEALKRSKAAIESTHQPHVLRGVGLFGGMTDLRMLIRESRYRHLALIQPIRGTSFEVASFKQLKRSARELVRKCERSCMECLRFDTHLTPVSFLDYVASSKLNPEVTADLISGMSELCSDWQYPIIGGETAEMPGIYQDRGMEIIGALTYITGYNQIQPMKDVMVYDLKSDLSKYEHPVLVQSIDGVGTKTMLATHYGSNIEDLVSHCINDIAVQGAAPLFMMIYADADAWKKDPKKQLREGIERLKDQVELKIVFSKPHPDVYQPYQIDLVGCVTGIVEREKIIDGSRIEPGDRLIGLASSGPHTNGYSLIRKIIKVKKLRLDQHFDELGCTLGEAVREPHRSYLNQIQALIKDCQVKGFAHITGGGLVDNVPRIIPDGCTALIDRSTWEVLPLFRLFQKWGNVHDMWRTFNMGIGLVAVVPKEEVRKALDLLQGMDQAAYIIGTVREREKKMVFVD